MSNILPIYRPAHCGIFHLDVGIAKIAIISKVLLAAYCYCGDVMRRISAGDGENHAVPIVSIVPALPSGGGHYSGGRGNAANGREQEGSRAVLSRRRSISALCHARPLAPMTQTVEGYWAAHVMLLVGHFISI